MRFAHAGGRNLDEARLGAHFVDGAAAGIAHARAHAAEQLLDHAQRAALERHAALDAFRHQLVDVHLGILEIAVGGALLHRAQRTHAPVRFVGASLVQLDFPGRLLGSGEQRSEHDHIRAGAQRLRDVARIADAAVGDQRNARFRQGLRHVHDRRYLRHADPGHHARRTDRARPDADLHAVRTVIDQGARAFAGADVAADDLHVWIFLLDPFDAVEYALGVPVRGIHHEDVRARIDQQFHPLIGAFADADGRTDAQLALRILAGVGVFGLLDDVLDRDQALQAPLLVHHQHALEPVLVQQREGVRPARAFAHGHQLLLRRHDVAHRLVELLLEAQVAVGDDADHLAGRHHRKARNAVLLLQRDDLAHAHVGGNGHGIAQHARLEAFDLGDLGRVLFRREILVDDADPAFLGDGDRQPGLGYRVHGGRNQRHVQFELAGKAGFQGNVARQDARVGGEEENIVEGQRLLDHPHDFPCLQSGIIRG